MELFERTGPVSIYQWTAPHPDPEVRFQRSYQQLKRQIHFQLRRDNVPLRHQDGYIAGYFGARINSLSRLALPNFMLKLKKELPRELRDTVFSHLFNNHHHWVRPPLEARSAHDTGLPLYERLGTVDQCYVKPGYSGGLVSEVMESFLRTSVVIECDELRDMFYHLQHYSSLVGLPLAASIRRLVIHVLPYDTMGIASDTADYSAEGWKLPIEARMPTLRPLQDMEHGGRRHIDFVIITSGLRRTKQQLEFILPIARELQRKGDDIKVRSVVERRLAGDHFFVHDFTALLDMSEEEAMRAVQKRRCITHLSSEVSELGSFLIPSDQFEQGQPLNLRTRVCNHKELVWSENEND